MNINVPLNLNRPQNIICISTALLIITISGCSLTDSPFPEVYNVSRTTYFEDNGEPFLAFDFEQTYTSGIDSQTSLKVRNLTTSMVCDTYTIDLRANSVQVWTYTGAVNKLSPGDTHVEGIISSNPARIDVGSIIISFPSNHISPFC